MTRIIHIHQQMHTFYIKSQIICTHELTLTITLSNGKLVIIMCFPAYQFLSFWEFTYPSKGEASSTCPAYTPQRYQQTKLISYRNYMYNMLLLLSNGRSWTYSINLLASQYSFSNSLEVWSSFGHTRRWSLSIIVFFSLHIVQFLWLKILMQWRCAARQVWPVLSWKFATACFLGLFFVVFPMKF